MLATHLLKKKLLHLVFLSWSYLMLAFLFIKLPKTWKNNYIGLSRGGTTFVGHLECICLS